MTESVGISALFNATSELAEIVDSVSRSKSLAAEFDVVAGVLARILIRGGTIYFAGNGGSAGDAQHLAAELVGRMTSDRGPLRGVAFTTDSSVLTAIANDFNFETVFERQARAFCKPGDAFVAITTSGRSRNIRNALSACRELGSTTVLLTGGSEGDCVAFSDFVLAVPSVDTQLVQVLHIFLGQALLQRVEKLIELEAENTA